MFKGLFGRKPSPADAPAAENPVGRAMAEAVADRRTEDPVAAAGIVAGEVLQRLIAGTTTERGIHIESLAVALGALAGHACQLAMLDGVEKKDPGYAGLSVAVADGSNGDQYWFGDAINRPLIESDNAFAQLVAGAAEAAGVPVPDFAELFAYNASVTGTDRFGVPRFAAGTSSKEKPRDYVRLAWPQILPTRTQMAPDPQEWPLVFGLAVQQLFAAAKGQSVDLETAARLIMESAIAMAKLKQS